MSGGGPTAHALQPKAAPIVACTISRDVSNFDLLIEDMEAELGESWGDLTFDDATVFLSQAEAESLQFVAKQRDADGFESELYDRSPWPRTASRLSSTIYRSARRLRRMSLCPAILQKEVSLYLFHSFRGEEKAHYEEPANFEITINNKIFYNLLNIRYSNKRFLSFLSNI